MSNYHILKFSEFQNFSAILYLIQVHLRCGKRFQNMHLR